MKILVIEDDECTSNLLGELLEKEEKHMLLYALTGEKGLELALNSNPDLIILDINLPDKDGYELCETIRNKPNVFGNPLILMLTSEIEQEQVINGFRKGADDYLKKPFNFDELILRVRALGKRKFENNIKWYKYESIAIDVIDNIVYENNEQISIKEKECKTLLYLIKNKGIIIPRKKILREIWDVDYSDGNRTVDMTISRLKKKLKAIDENLETVSGIGYKLK